MLLAKRQPRDDTKPKELAEHSHDVLNAAQTMFVDNDGPSALGLAWLRFFRLTLKHWPSFRANLEAAALLHDIGKANDGFQDAMVYGGDRQLLRHEHLSALMLALPDMQAWLAANPLLQPVLIISAVAGHHLKASRTPPKRAGYPAFGASYCGRDNQVLVIREPEAVMALLGDVARRLDLRTPPEVPTFWTLDGSGGVDLIQARGNVERLFKRVRRDGQTPMLPALKAALIAADAAGSGLPREGHRIEDWLRETFNGSRLTGADIHTEVLANRIAEIERHKRAAEPDYRFRFHDFQDGAGGLPSRALLLAACGTGKTLAAWRWIAAQLDAAAAQHAIFLYPTRATATEGFKDYVSHAPEHWATLLTGTARYELRGMFDNPDDPRGERSYETDARLFAVGVWRKRLLSATVDQFLGFMQQVYASACLLPVLAKSVVVIDEVHSFDTDLFSALTRFLEAFDLPVLCMTASLPSQRRQRLEGLGFRPYPENLGAFDDLRRLAEAPRYRVARLDDSEAAERIAKQALSQHQRVLWVVNTVDRCQQLSKRLSDHDVLCYHSRFRLQDRNQRHREVIQRFAEPSGGLLAITTQVCEMSLDLDADLLISEHAPITALIQRMGRCNRHHKPGRRLGEVYLYAPENRRPYDAAEIDAADAFIADLCAAAEGVSQTFLEQRLEHYSAKTAIEPKRLTAFLDDGPWARGGEEALRDGDDFTVPAIRDTDIDQWQPGAEGLVVPVPRKLAQPDPRLPRHLHRAPADHYSPLLGFCKQPVDAPEGDNP